MFSYKVHTVQQRYNMNHLLAPLTSTVSAFKLLCTKGDTPSHNAINTKITSFVSLSDQCLLWKVVLNTNANVVDDNIYLLPNFQHVEIYKIQLVWWLCTLKTLSPRDHTRPVILSMRSTCAPTVLSICSVGK